MPQNHQLAREQWLRYVYARDTGHLDYVKKAVRCEDFVEGGDKQWDPRDKAELDAARRPALTLNKTLLTLNSICGEQIDTRTETVFRPRYNAPPDAAEIHTKVYKFIGDQNQLNWVRSAVFADGAVTSRGYFDVRLDFSKNLAGDVAITQLNGRNVLPDPDAAAYDPDKWNDVIVTSWFTGDDIQLLYNKADADALRRRVDSAWAFGYDSIDMGNDRFGGSIAAQAVVTEEMKPMLRNIRVLERQHRVLTKRRVFVDVRLGMKRPIPDEWTRDQVAQFLSENGQLVVSEELVKRIRWTVTADDFVLLDEWSPYKHFTIVPYFPVFRYGRTIGLIEHVLGPQEYLNKVSSQELHVVNTMANSGWKVRSNAILNMTLEELEELGAKTGLVLEIAGDPDKDVVKIAPNPVPQGLDRISFKAEQLIKSISGRGDSVMGLDRADVSGKAIGEKKESADVPLRPALDNLERSDFILARSIIDIVQQYYTDPRILNITKDDLTGEMETVSVNQPQPGSGEVMHDLSLGEFDIVITSQSAKRTLEESQFQQGIAMRELGIQIPDKYLIKNSNLLDKANIVKDMEQAANSPEAQLEKKNVALAQSLEVANLKGDAVEKESKATLNKAKTAETLAKAQAESGGQDGEMILAKQKHDQEMQQSRELHDQKMQQMREEAAAKAEERQMMARVKEMEAKAKAVIAVKQAAKPAPAKGGNMAAQP